MINRKSYIDLLKFFFAIIVVLRHAELAMCGHLAVEFFFNGKWLFYCSKS